jgi:hypothetical protein
MERHGWSPLRGIRTARAVVPLATLLVAAVAVIFFVGYAPFGGSPGSRGPSEVMLILRGIASSEKPRGQLDDQSALEYARRLGYRGEVLDVAGNSGADSPQIKMALDRIRHDEKVTALYGFSGGGYNAPTIWTKLNDAQRQRIGKIVVIGSPGVTEADFPGSVDVLIKEDPPAGHMAGPKTLLESPGSEAERPAKPSGG